MKASEKLRALDEAGNLRTCRVWLEGDQREIDITDVLIAVVEAAEEVGEDLGGVDAGEVPSGFEELYFALVALNAKLAESEEAA